MISRDVNFLKWILFAPVVKLGIVELGDIPDGKPKAEHVAEEEEEEDGEDDDK